MRSIARFILPLTVALALGGTSAEAAPCRDTSGFDAARAAVDAAVPCDGARSHGAYVRAASRALKSTGLRGACRRDFLARYVKRSLCGRAPGRFELCCRQNAAGRNTSAVVRAGRCGRGDTCPVGLARSVGDACADDGRCVVVTTSTTTTTSTSTTAPARSTTTTIVFGTAPTTTTVVATSTTSTAPASTVTTTSSTSTTSTTFMCTGPNCFFDFTNGSPVGTCGETRDGAGAVLTEITCGGLLIGGGASMLPEGPTPDGSVSRFRLECTESVCAVAPTTLAPAPDSAEPDCTDTGCAFGAPLPIANPAVPQLSTCVINTLESPASGALDLATGDAILLLPLASKIHVTGNAVQPCPRCSATGAPDMPERGTCDGGARTGQACTTTSVAGLSRDCPPHTAQAIGTISVNISPLTTGTADKVAASGLFCNDQSLIQVGCFGEPTCRRIIEVGEAPGPLAVDTPTPLTLASAFCIPSTGSPQLDATANLPGPGAVALRGTVTVRGN